MKRVKTWKMIQNNPKIEIMDEKIAKIAKLISDYMCEYDKDEHPFLLFDLAHVNENDHTRVLMGILKYNHYQFLPSFLQMIGFPDECSNNPISVKELTDQKKAIGNKGTGFIDLYIEYEYGNNQSEKVIIENKIFGAGDVNRQLARYIATAINPDMDSNCFEQKWEQWAQKPDYSEITENDIKNIHVIYLTSDGLKEPGDNSLPNYFRGTDENGAFKAKHISYYPINYQYDIIPWLENEVLPYMPYADDGIAIAGARQYIASLKSMLNGKGDSKSIEEYVNNLSGSDLEKYECVLKTMNVIKSITNKETEKKKNNIVVELKKTGLDVKDLSLLPLLRDLRTAAISIFAKDGSDLGEDWKLYFTPTFIFLYRQKWADLDKRKYSIPSICFQTFTDVFFKKEVIKWKLQVDHLDSKKERNNLSQFKLGNRNKTAYYEMPVEEKIDCRDSNGRKSYYKNVLMKLEEFIKKVDAIVDEVRENPNKNEPFQETVLSKLDNKLL